MHHRLIHSDVTTPDATTVRLSMPYLRDRVFILKSEPFREHDRRIVCYGKQHGLLEAVARGASASRAKQGGHLVPMVEADVMIARGAVFDKLAVARIALHHRAIRARLGALAVIGAFFDLFISLQRPGIVDAECYALLEDLVCAVERLPEDPTPERARLLFAAASLKLLDITGFAPQLVRCALCRGSLSEDDLVQLASDGTVLHADCHRDIRSREPRIRAISLQSLALANFLRRESLASALLLAGSSYAFAETADLVFGFLPRAPLFRAPHGMRTIGELLG